MNQQSALDGIRVVLLDVEGTVAPISFVYEVLFPFARDNVELFLAEHWDVARADVPLFRELAEEDARLGTAGVIPIPGEGSPEDAIRHAVCASVLWQMSADRKSTALKSLQGKIWKVGFESGELKSVVFGDVPAAMKRWVDQDLRVAIYSSGSVQAQKLFFRYTREGDLSPYLSGHFDTHVGAKREASSYEAIAQALDVEPAAVLFATDVVAEADAAQQAGMRAVILDRPGNPNQPAHAHLVWEDFEL